MNEPAKETPVQEAAPPAEESPETVEARVNAIMSGLGYAAPKPPPEPARESAPPKQETPAAPEPKEKPKPKKKPEQAKPQEAPVVQTPIDPDALASKIADKIKPVEPPPQPSALSEWDKRQRAILEVMSEQKDYASLPKEYDAFITVRDRYIKDWQAKNPDEEFDPESSEHDDFFKANQPKWDDAAFAEAAGALGARREIERKWQEKIAAETLERVSTQVQQQASSQIETQAEDLRASTAAKLTDLVGENTLLDEEGPIQRMQSQAEADLALLIEETHKLLSPELGYKADSRYPAHRYISSALQDSEATIAELSREDLAALLKNGLGQKHHLAGKIFATFDQYVKLSPAQKARAWTLYNEPKLVSALMAVQVKNRLNSDLDALFRQVGAKRADSPSTKSVSEPSQTGVIQEPVLPASRTGHTPSPSISSSADRVTPASSQPAQPKNFADIVAEALSR